MLTDLWGVDFLLLSEDVMCGLDTDSTTAEGFLICLRDCPVRVQKLGLDWGCGEVFFTSYSSGNNGNDVAARHFSFFWTITHARLQHCSGV